MKIVSLKKKLEFKLLFRSGKKVFQDHLNFIYLFHNFDNETLHCLKIAYIVSKKISSKAVVRNKIKRRMRASVAQVLKDKEEQLKSLKTGLMIAIRASSNKIIDASFQQIQSEIKQSFEQVI